MNTSPVPSASGYLILLPILTLTPSVGQWDRDSRRDRKPFPFLETILIALPQFVEANPALDDFHFLKVFHFKPP